MRVAGKFSSLRPTVAFDSFWKYAAERQAIFFRRVDGEPPPWTSDETLTRFKFTNVYRASDRVSQFLIRDVIYRGLQSAEETFFRTILFKLFNRIGTWQLLERAFGEVTFAEFDRKQYCRVLDAELNAGRRLFSAAYIMPSGLAEFGRVRKHEALLLVLERMMSDEVPQRVANALSLEHVFRVLRSYPMFGDFLAFQYAIDLNYSNLINFSEMDFVVAGPGAKGGISKCFENAGQYSEVDVIRMVADGHRHEFEERGLLFRSLWGREPQLIDWQNVFCELDKYSRVKHPEIVGNSKRTRIKQTFQPHSTRVAYWYPPKWGINELVPRGNDDELGFFRLSE